MGAAIYELSRAAIEKHVQFSTYGNYALGHRRGDGFVPKYVGRSEDLPSRLLTYTGTCKYSAFKFAYAQSELEMIDHECRNYHDFIEQLDNEIHPERPSEAGLCPYC
jgi:hypothetical protein